MYFNDEFDELAYYEKISVNCPHLENNDFPYGFIEFHLNDWNNQVDKIYYCCENCYKENIERF